MAIQRLDGSTSSTNGNAEANGNFVDLLDGETHAAGGITLNDQVSLNQNFHFSTSFTHTGEDGFAFVLHNAAGGPSALGGTGGNLGALYGDISDGIAITFDSYDNANESDVSDNSTALVDTDLGHDSADQIVTSTHIDDGIADLDGGNSYALDVHWEATTNTLTWSLEGQTVGSSTFSENELDDMFGGARAVYTGVTASNYSAGEVVLEDPQIEATFVCFGADTLLETIEGNRPANEIVVGDMLLSTSGAYEAVKWVGRRMISPHDVDRNEKLYPVRIKAGALGSGLPHRDLLVSRQHRMVISSKVAERITGSRGILIAAIKLTGLPGVYVDKSISSIEYVHVLLDRHSIIFAEGAATESLFTGPEALKALSRKAREEIAALFPEMKKENHAPVPALYIPTGKIATQILSHHALNSV